MNGVQLLVDLHVQRGDVAAVGLASGDAVGGIVVAEELLAGLLIRVLLLMMLCCYCYDVVLCYGLLVCVSVMLVYVCIIYRERKRANYVCMYVCMYPCMYVCMYVGR